MLPKLKKSFISDLVESEWKHNFRRN